MRPPHGAVKCSNAYLVPFVEDEHMVFLKTIIPQPQGDEAIPR